MSDFQAIAKVLRAVEKVKNDVQFQEYGTEDNWEARVDPVILDALIKAWEEALV